MALANRFKRGVTLTASPCLLSYNDRHLINVIFDSIVIKAFNYNYIYDLSLLPDLGQYYSFHCRNIPGSTYAYYRTRARMFSFAFESRHE